MKYQILFLKFPILIIRSKYIDKKEFKRITKYAKYVKRINDIVIFEFQKIVDYQEFCRLINNDGAYLLLPRMRDNSYKPLVFENINNDIILARIIDSTFTYRVPLKVLFLMLEVLYKKGQTNIDEFDKLLHQHNLIPKNKSLVDKHHGTVYQHCWIGPYRILQQFGLETGLILVQKPNKSSLTTFVNLKDLSLEDLKKELYYWIIKKINRG